MSLELLQATETLSEVEELEQESEGLEISIEDLLEDTLSKPPEERSAYERKLQQIYKTHPHFLNIQSSIREAAFLGALVASGDAIHCEKCGQVYRIGEWPLCGSGFGRDHSRVIPRMAQSNTVTEYYINHHTGNVWIPGAKSHQPTDKFGNPIKGYEKMEVRNFSERDKFYRFMDQKAKDKYFSNLSREQQTFEPMFAEGRKQARHDIISTEGKSPEASFGREMLSRMMEKTEREGAKKLNYSPNTSLDAWEMDSPSSRKDGPDSTFDVNIRQNIMQPILQERHKKLIGKGANRKVSQAPVSKQGKAA